MQSFESIMRRGGSEAIQQATSFFMRTDPVHRALTVITKRLDQLGIAYAVAGGMALVAHGYDRTTVDVNILLTADGLDRARRELDLGFVAPLAGSKNLRETSTGVRIEFLVAGQYPGDGKPKPIAFPDPATASTEIDGIRYLNLPKLVELKLASGISAPHRLRDLADVQELIRVLRLPESFAEQLDPSVRDKFHELRRALDGAESE